MSPTYFKASRSNSSTVCSLPPVLSVLMSSIYVHTVLTFLYLYHLLYLDSLFPFISFSTWLSPQTAKTAKFLKYLNWSSQHQWFSIWFYSGLESPTHALRADADPSAQSASATYITLAEEHQYDRHLEIILHLSGKGNSVKSYTSPYTNKLPIFCKFYAFMMSVNFTPNYIFASWGEKSCKVQKNWSFGHLYTIINWKTRFICY